MNDGRVKSKRLVLIDTFDGDVSALSISISKSNMQNVSGGTDFVPEITTVFPVCASKWALLGDLTKYVA